MMMMIMRRWMSLEAFDAAPSGQFKPNQEKFTHKVTAMMEKQVIGGGGGGGGLGGGGGKRWL